ncbi:hypothetical protein M885DRAFT_529136 [Pelagophyceae sp. CCMP2097]|nr:hypothetical protein M885DRAFT_529136 [Pelagophyceae sp. CCMP2097]|mmetsp:Transcript_31260/g.108049  ORF Transcript_31260/g.108049 Transcript_31260/m.108049 type:complete len:324 (-) Transcript_31260:1539-2510(-)
MDYLFSKPSFNCCGDPYHDPSTLSGHGTSKNTRQFQTAPPKKGQTSNPIGYGPLEFKGLYLPGKEQFQETFKLQAQRRLDGKKKFGTPNGFGYSSPMKKSSSPGDVCGTFGGAVEHSSDGVDKKGDPKNKVDVEGIMGRRNIQTSPSKRGGYGVAGTLIGGQVEYVSSAYDALDEQARVARRVHKGLMGERKPFSSMSRQTEFFDAHDHCAVSKIHGNDGSAFANQPMHAEKERRSSDIERIFRPSSPAKVGHNGALNAFPEALPEPFDERVLRRSQMPLRRQPAAESNVGLSAAILERKPFRPTSCPRTGVSRPMCTVGIRA